MESCAGEKDMDSYVAVNVNKSLPLDLGRIMYSNRLEAVIRELVANAYDADATIVKIEITEDDFSVEDNGSGMDREGLNNYWEVGTEDKKKHPITPIFNRKKIGEFGIGKFAALSMAEEFEVTTKCKDFVATMIFREDEWIKVYDWKVPLSEYSDLNHDGTKVTLRMLKTELKDRINIESIKKYVRERAPLGVENFSVTINGKAIHPKIPPGTPFKIDINEFYGKIEGVLVFSRQVPSEPGIACKVKNVTIKRSLFDTESWGRKVNRITGWVNADWLPIKSDRSDFIKDDLRYEVFYNRMRNQIQEILDKVKKRADEKETKRVAGLVNNVAKNLKKALNKNRDLIPEGDVFVSKSHKDAIDKEEIYDGTAGMEEFGLEERGEGRKKEKERKESYKKLHITSPNPRRTIRKLKIKDFGVHLDVQPLPDSGEVETNGNVITINSLHKLFEIAEQEDETLVQHIVKLYSQEIAMIKKPANPREAFDWQSRLFTDTMSYLTKEN